MEHPEFGPPLNPCGADTLVREAATNPVQREVQVEPQNASQKTVTTEPAAKRQKNAALSASRGKPENNSDPKERKPSARESQEKELARVQAAIAGAERGNWRDLRTVLQFAGIDTRTLPATQETMEGPTIRE